MSQPKESRVRVLLFSVLREKIGERVIDVSLDVPVPVDEFLSGLAARSQPIAEHRSSIRVAVNQVYANGEDLVSPGDEVALITPVSGG